MIINKEMKICSRELFLWIVLIAGIFITLTTEVLSLFNFLNRLSILICWLILFLFGLVKLNNLSRLNSFNILSKKNISSSLIFFSFLSLFIILFMTFLTALIYPPNTPDSMSYHMPRVMHWIQNQNVDFYPTSTTRQLYVSPFSEYVILHLQLIVNGDRLANLVQWFSMFGSLIGVSLIARELGGNTKSQIFSALFCATIPMGILQSTSTQTDYVVSFWIVILVYFLLCYIRHGLPAYIYGFAVVLGLGVLTKQTVYIFALPFCIWLLINVIKKKPYHFFHLLIIPLVIVLLNFGHFSRNINLYGNPIGIHEDNAHTSITNEVFNLHSVSSNVVKNLSLNLTVPSSTINKMTRNAIVEIHDLLGVSVNDNKISFEKFWIHFSLYESTASNTLHFFIIIFIIFLMITRRFFDASVIAYVGSIAAGFLFFSILLKWQPWGNRLMLPLFILFAPFVGFSLFKLRSKILSYVVIISIVFYAFPYIFMNKIRPLIGTIEKPMASKFIMKIAPVWTSNRNKLYFTYDPELYKPFKAVANIIRTSNCKTIAINSGNGWEYPLWVLTRDRKNISNPKIFHIGVTNLSSTVLKNENNEKPCAVFKFKYGSLDKSSTSKFTDKFINKFSNPPIYLFY